MNGIADALLTDLRRLIGDLGTDGGLIGPSVYDTAQVLRLAPPADSVWPAFEWLLAQQRPDGGWGNPETPRTRDIATLAALLALQKYSRCDTTYDRIQEGVSFLRRQAAQWTRPLPDDIPLAAELVLPTLVAQARQQEIDISSAPYAGLSALGERRRRMIAEVTIRPGTSPVHSWETWGQDLDGSLIDGAGSIGHSPAATAAWLHATQRCANLSDARAAARQYLERAAQVTGVGIPGVVPTVWPYGRNEQSVSLFALFLAGLHSHPALCDILRAQTDDVWRGLRPEGQGISDHFAADGDITAMNLVIVTAAGYQPNRASLQHYIVNDYCMTYPNELQRSLSATAHAAHALALLGGDPTPLLDYLCKRRAADGYWAGDKWHASWFYLTSHTIHALLQAGRVEDALPAQAALIDHQRPDGSWGVTDATGEETAYAVLGLLAFKRAGALSEQGSHALRRAGTWLLSRYRPHTEGYGACWIAKEMYRPRRISWASEIIAALAWVCDDAASVPKR